MRIADESEWQDLLAQFAQDPNQQVAGGFRDFVVAWAEEAEVHIEVTREVTYSDFGDEVVNELSPIEALRRTLRVVEQRTSRWTVGFLGQALLMLGHHWEPAAADRAEFFGSLTSIEQNLYLDVAAAWVDLNSDKAGNG